LWFQNPARQTAIAGLPKQVSAMTINKVLLVSGLKAVAVGRFKKGRPY